MGGPERETYPGASREYSQNQGLWVEDWVKSSVWVLDKANYLPLDREPTEFLKDGISQDRALSVGRGIYMVPTSMLGPSVI